METFSKVVYVKDQKEIAKVNRADRSLYISSEIWKGLPADQREFVLLHEKGHLELKTADEFEANRYAVKEFAPVGTLTSSELGKRIVVMRNILTPRESGFLAEAIAGAVGGITKVLPVLGIGSQSRINETEAAAAAQSQIIEAQAKADSKKSNTTIIVVVLVGVLLIVMGSLYLILKK
jgi:hypothetical protein